MTAPALPSQTFRRFKLSAPTFYVPGTPLIFPFQQSDMFWNKLARYLATEDVPAITTDASEALRIIKKACDYIHAGFESMVRRDAGLSMLVDCLDQLVIAQIIESDVRSGATERIGSGSVRWSRLGPHLQIALRYIAERCLSYCVPSVPKLDFNLCCLPGPLVYGWNLALLNEYQNQCRPSLNLKVVLTFDNSGKNLPLEMSVPSVDPDASSAARLLTWPTATGSLTPHLKIHSCSQISTGKFAI